MSASLPTEAILDLIDSIQGQLERLRGMVQPQAFEFDPRDPHNKLPDGKLTPRGVEVCYRLFDAGKTRYAVAEEMGISYGAATHRLEAWKKAGGIDREKAPTHNLSNQNYEENIMFDVNTLKTATEARNLMANAEKIGRRDVYQAAFRRLGQIEGKNHDDPVIRAFWVAVAAVEEVLRQKHGKAVKANYTRRKAAKVGEVACLTDWALNKHETEGFKMLVAAGLGDQTGEYVVVSYPDRFPPEAVAAARKRLVEHGVISENQP